MLAYNTSAHVVVIIVEHCLHTERQWCIDVKVVSAPFSMRKAFVSQEVGLTTEKERVPAMTPQGCGGRGQASLSVTSAPSCCPVSRQHSFYLSPGPCYLTASSDRKQAGSVY